MLKRPTTSPMAGGGMVGAVDGGAVPDGAVVGVVYVTRSTQPVLVELYRIRSGLVRVLAVAVCFTGALVLLLALGVSRPLSRLSRAASRIAAGEQHVEVPIGGSGEVRELAEAFAAMKAPVQTVTIASASRPVATIQAWNSGSPETAFELPPGSTRMSGFGASAIP